MVRALVARWWHWPITVWLPFQEGHGNIVRGKYGRALVSGARGNHYQVSCRRQVWHAILSGTSYAPFCSMSWEATCWTITVCTQCCTSIVLSFLDSFIQRQCGQPFCCVIWDTLGQNLAKKKKSTLTNPAAYKVEVLMSLDQGPW